MTFETLVQELRDLQVLREADANLRRALLHRIDDRLTLENPRLRLSIEQMKTGRRHYVHRRGE